MHKINHPVVSIIIPSFNRPVQTLRAVESALNQNLEYIEVVVIDDNGKGASQQVETFNALAAHIKKNDIQYIAHEKNLGGNSARNTGVQKARGKYIAFLDSDDEFLPKKIETQLAYIESKNDPSIKGVTCGRINIKNSNVFRVDRFEFEGNLTFHLLSLEFSLGAGSTLLIEKSALKEIGLFNTKLLRHQEIEMLIRYFRNGFKIKVLPAPLVKIHVDDRSNIPTPELFIENKRRYLELVLPAIQSLPKKQQKLIYSAHNMEIAKNCIRYGSYLRAVKYILLARPNYKLISSFLKSIFSFIKLRMKFFKKKSINQVVSLNDDKN